MIENGLRATRAGCDALPGRNEDRVQDDSLLDIW